MQISPVIFVGNISVSETAPIKPAPIAIKAQIASQMKTPGTFPNLESLRLKGVFIAKRKLA